ncbi:MAG: oligoendopeptidase F [Malacoplasma sp.]
MKSNKYNWDLESLLENDTLDSLFNKWIEQKDKILSLFDQFCETEKNFINWKNENIVFAKISNRLINYVSNNLNEDVNNEKWISWSQKISNEMQELSKKTSSSANIVIKNKSKVLKYLNNPILKDYVREYDIFFKSQKHILSPKEEKLLSTQSIIDDGFEEVYSSLVDGTITFDSVKTSTGKTIKIKNSAEFSKLLISKDRTLRKNAWYSFHNGYFKYKNLLAQLLYYNYLMLNNNAKIRKYNDYIDQSCHEDEINKSFILSIYSNTKKYKPLLIKFEKARNIFIKGKYKIDKIEPWDKGLQLNSNNKKYSIEDIKKIVLESLSSLGRDYIEIVEKAFNENWISWLPKPNKHSGAYSIGGTLGLTKYYISMNYDETINSLYTVAHELGHSLHSYYFNTSQIVNASCEIFYAEIASITNEVILSLHLLEKEKRDINKLEILDELLTGFFSTTTRQIIFSNFEYQMIEKLNNNQPITFETIKAAYYDSNKEFSYATKSKFFNKKYEPSISTILRISHFYVGNFYVYKYAVGQIPALISAYKIFKGDKVFIEKYKAFLKSGSSLSPLDTIKLLGIDLEKEDSWNESVEIINKLIDEFITIANKLKKNGFKN